MKIQRITFRSDRDFSAIYVCEHCATTEKHYGYDDANFHVNVIPSWHCGTCGRNRAGDGAVTFCQLSREVQWAYSTFAALGVILGTWHALDLGALVGKAWERWRVRLW